MIAEQGRGQHENKRKQEGDQKRTGRKTRGAPYTQLLPKRLRTELYGTRSGVSLWR